MKIYLNKLYFRFNKLNIIIKTLFLHMANTILQYYTNTIDN